MPQNSDTATSLITLNRANEQSKRKKSESRMSQVIYCVMLLQATAERSLVTARLPVSQSADGY